MRIISGRHRGRKLHEPQGQGIRPTSDRARESLFNILMHASFCPPLHGAKVMDVFAGTGAVGFEALSRGAAHVTFVEKSQKSLDLLRRNISLLKAKDETVILATSAHTLPKATQPMDLVFMDPPYQRDLAVPALLSLINQGWLKAGTVLVLETAADESPDIPSTLKLETIRKSGETAMHFMTYVPAP